MTVRIKHKLPILILSKYIPRDDLEHLTGQ